MGQLPVVSILAFEHLSAAVDAEELVDLLLCRDSMVFSFCPDDGIFDESARSC